MSTLIRYSFGRNLNDNYPAQRNAASFTHFAAQLERERAPDKATAAYFCAPFSGNSHRSASGAQPRRFLPVDIDRMTPDVAPDVRMWFAKFSGVAWATHSSVPEAPRDRVVIELDREAAPEECVQVGAALIEEVRAKFGSAVEIDDSTFRSEQPNFVAPPGVRFAHFQGDPLRVDEYLARAPVVEAKPNRVEHLANQLDADPILQHLKSRDYVRETARDGKVWIHCPFEDEHTTDGGHFDTIYYPAHTGGYAKGHFKCMHSHCANRSDKDFLAKLKYSEPEIVLAADTTGRGTTMVSLSEDNIAVVFAQRHGGQLLFDHTSGRWLTWDGVRWRPESTRLAYEFARQLTRTLNTDGKARWAKAAVYSSVETIARADRSFARTLDEFDTDPWLLCTPGGIVDLRTGTIGDSDPAKLMTRTTLVAPEAGEPVRWLRFLNEATGGDQEVVDFLQRLLGYCLTGLVNEHVLVFIFGPGGNGKGVFLNVVMRILADYAQGADVRTFTMGKHDRHPTELAALRGARLVSASETEQGAEWAESRLKMLTGGDVVRARFMRQDEFEYRPQFKLVIVGNYRPRLRDVGESMRRRLRIIPFEHKPVVVNPNLEAELLAEEGRRILNWMVEGCLAWQRDGLPTPLMVRAATDDYFTEQDTLGEWLTTCCDQDSRASERASELFRSWSDYCHATGEREGTKVAFADALKRRGFSNRRTMVGVTWSGIRLRAHAENPS